jgi:hypothetical protein
VTIALNKGFAAPIVMALGMVTYWMLAAAAEAVSGSESSAKQNPGVIA